MKYIFAYPTYREFLRDAYLEEKRSSRKITLAEYAKTFGMGAPAFNMILSGTRNLTMSNLHEIAKALKLSRADREYFEALVLRDQAQDTEVRSYYSRRLKQIGRNAKVKSLRISDKRLLSNWIVPALLIYLIDIEKIKSREDFERLDLNGLGSKFGLSLAQIKSLFQVFHETELLKIDSEESVHIIFDKLTHHLPQREYLQMVLGELNRRIDTDFEKQDTLFRAFVFSLPKEHISTLCSDLISLFEKYIAMHSPDSPETVLIQSMVGLFPAVR